MTRNGLQVAKVFAILFGIVMLAVGIWSLIQKFSGSLELSSNRFVAMIYLTILGGILIWWGLNAVIPPPHIPITNPLLRLIAVVVGICLSGVGWLLLYVSIYLDPSAILVLIWVITFSMMLALLGITIIRKP